jgi:hypothetical protein
VGGASSDDTEIRHELRSLGYDEEDCRAILRSKTPLGAAVFRVARELGMKPSSVRTSLRRARRETASSHDPLDPQSQHRSSK